MSIYHQEFQVYHFRFTAYNKRRSITVASPSREEARALILASFKGAGDLRESKAPGGSAVERAQS
jgi:hypothetical protein